MSRIGREKIVKDLIEVVNENRQLFRPGVIRDSDGLPILKISQAPYKDALREQGERILRAMATGNPSFVDETVNELGGLAFTIWENVLDASAPAIVVPTALSATSLALVIGYIARTTPTRQGDALSNRVALCGYIHCGKFFLRKTRHPSRHCSDRCRWRAVLRKS